MVRARFLRTTMGALILSGLSTAAPGGLAQSSAPRTASADTQKAGDAAKTSVGQTPAPVTNSAVGRTPTIPANALFPLALNYQMWNNSLMMVDALLDGKPQKCILDTGLNACAVSPDFAANLSLIGLPSKVTVATLNESRSASETDLKNIQFNAVKMGTMRVGILDVSELYMGETQPDAPGVWLGTPFLSAFQVTLLYDQHVIMLNRPDLPLPKGKGAITVPIELRDGRIYTRVSIPKAGSFMALVDTSAMGTLIPGSIADKLKTPPVKIFTIKQAGGRQAQAALITIPKLQIGRLEQLQVPVLYIMAAAKAKPADKESAASKNASAKEKSVSEAKAGSQETSKPQGSAETKSSVEPDRELAVLGNDFLRQYKVTISFAQSKMALIPPPPVKKDEGDISDKDTVKKPVQTRQPTGASGTSSRRPLNQ